MNISIHNMQNKYNFRFCLLASTTERRDSDANTSNMTIYLSNFSYSTRVLVLLSFIRIIPDKRCKGEHIEIHARTIFV